MKYYSQVGQDKFLHKKVFKDFRNGVFLDLGAFDGITLSNTYFFEKQLKWRGWCFEPIPKYFKILKSKRKAICLNYGISNKRGKEKFLLIKDAPMLSGICSSFSNIERKKLREQHKVKEIDIHIKPISTFLEKRRITEINYLSLDIEGREEDILKDINFQKTFIDVISVEDNNNLKKVDNILKQNNFMLLKQNYFDKIFINQKSRFFKKKLYFYIIVSRFQNIFYKSKLYNFIFRYIRRIKWLHNLLIKICYKK